VQFYSLFCVLGDLGVRSVFSQRETLFDVHEKLDLVSKTVYGPPANERRLHESFGEARLRERRRERAQRSE